MADSPCFERVCEVVERETSLDRLEARGTVRLTLKAAGLDPCQVTPEQMRVVIEKVLPAELESRGIENPDGVCAVLRRGLATVEAAPNVAGSPEDVFARLGGS